MKGRTPSLWIAALALLTLVSTAQAQIAFRSSSSASTNGPPPTPAFRAAARQGVPLTIVGESRVPAADDSVATATSASITPPSGMQANDLVLVWVTANVSSATTLPLTPPATGGQTWSSFPQNGSSPVTMVYRAVFNGTWSGNPSFSWGSTAAAYQIWMVVVRGTPTQIGGGSLSDQQDFNCCPVVSSVPTNGSGALAAPASPFDVTIPAGTFNTNVDNALIFAHWASSDDNTWALQTPGWSNVGGLSQWRTMAAAGGAGADISASLAYLSQASAGSVPAVTNRQMTLGGDSGAWRMFALRSLALQKPPGTVAGDVMIATIAVQLDTITLTPPAGWTLINRIVVSSSKTGFYQLYTYWRAADASDASVSGYSFVPGSGVSSWVGAIQSFSGVDTTTPIDVQSGAGTAVALTHATPSVTTTGANRMIVTSHMVIQGNLSWTPPAGMTEALEFRRGSGTPGASAELSYVLQPAAGATGTKTATISGSTSVAGAAQIIALRPAAGGGSNTLTISAPAGVVQNDVLIASIGVRPTTATITPPSGWTLVRRMNNSNGADNALAVYTKLAGAAEPASYAWTFSTADGASGGIVAFSGADPAIDVENGQNTPSASTHTTPSVTTGVANTMLVTSHGEGNNGTWTPPAGMTEAVDIGSDKQMLEMNYVPQSALGATGTKTATASNNETGNAHILALRRVLGSFNAFETSTASGSISGVIKTKVAGTSVSVDVASLNALENAIAVTFIGTVRVEVLNASDNSAALDGDNCRSSWTVIQTLPDITFVPADNGRKTITFTQADAYPNVRLRMSSPAGAPIAKGCSTDNFALRPNQFTTVTFKDADWQTAGTTRTLNNLTVPGGTVHKAGQPLTVQATAVNGAGTPATTTNYTGTATATVAACSGSNACVASPAGTFTVGGTFSAGQLTSNVANYSDVGAIAVTLVDSTFAAVDASDGSTAAERNITSSPINVGRFVPDHFAVSYNTPSFATACAAGSFSYVGQKFSYATAPVLTVTAQNASNATTLAYTGTLWQITSSSLTGKSYTAAGSIGIDFTGITGTDPVIADGGNGTGTLTFGSGTGLFFTRSTTTAVTPFNADISLAINVIDADSVVYASNPARFGQATAGNGIAFSSGKEMRFGRLAFKNANGSQLVPLPVRVEAQYYAYTNPPTNTQPGFVTNTADNCTSLANTDVQMSSFTANLSACETAISSAGTLSSGRKTLLLLAPGNANNGSVLLTANLGTASGTTCTSVGGATVSATAANRSYLQGNWASSNSYTSDPSARATFGTVKGADEVIYMRENF
jgi:hypothetical protein